MKRLIMCAFAIAASAFAAVAASVPVDTKLDDGTLAVTNQVTVSPAGMPLEFLTLQNDSTFSNTVTVTATVLGGDVSIGTLYSGTLTAAASTTVYPVRAFDDGATTNRPYIVSGVKITVTSASGATNSVDGTVNALFQSQ